MIRRLRPRGLRVRLVVAFALVAALSVAVTAWSSAESAGRALVASAEHQLVRAVADQIGATAPALTYPPGQESLDRLRSAVGADTLVVYRSRRSSAGSGPGLITPELRGAVTQRNRLVTQRVLAGDRPWLLIGTPVMITAPDGTRRASGIQVYAARDLTGVDQQIDDLVRSALGTATLALALAVLLALLAAGSVLRPVAKLRDTARRLADGDLGARTPPLGADELADLTVTVNEMAASVQTSMTTMQRMQTEARRFAADASHELRTPLSTLTAVVEVLDDATVAMDTDAREAVLLAVTETHRLVTLVEDLMEVSRFDAGTAGLRLEVIDLSSAIHGTLTARGWRHQVEVTMPSGLSARVDQRRLDVIVANLVGNALRHGAPPVRVDVATTAGQLRIEVTDGGPGLSAEVSAHVFDRFWKADAARTRTPGSGLGLAIARENARLHGGDLTVGNTDQAGARFVVVLPTGSQCA